MAGAAADNKPDFDQARYHLIFLDPAAPSFVFQTFDDSPSKTPALARVLCGTFDECAQQLAELNRRGAGVFVTVNRSSNGGRKKADIVSARAVWREADEPGLAQLPITPHLVVETSPGKHHEYLLTDTADLDTWDAVMRTMVGVHGSDPNAKDRSRVLRLAGFFHCKGTPHKVRIVEENDRPRYTLDEIARHIPPTRPAQEDHRQKVNSSPTDRYAASALSRELTELSCAPESTRNDQLNRAAFNLGQLVGGGELDRAHVENALASAAIGIGLPPGEVQATIRSGLDAGIAKPRKAPERPESRQKQERAQGPEEKQEHPPLIYIPCWDNCPPEAEPLVKLNDTPVLHRGNLAMLTAGAGQGKTAASHGALPTLVHADNETLGLSAFGDGATVLDTEHDERLFNLLWQRFMFRCGFSRGTPAPDNIRFKNIRAVEKLSERLDILWDEFQSCQGLLMVDGIGDFVADPNNSDECTALVYRLSSEAQKHDIGVFVTLHNNPVVGNEKARGVLGSELWRKAQSTLMIKRGGDGIAQITTEYSLGKNRQNSDRLSAYFTWDDDLKMHVACDPPEEGGGIGKSAKQQQEIIMALRGEYTHKDLVALVMEVAGVKERQARNKVSDLVAQGVIEKTDQNLYRERSTTHWSDDI